MRTSPSVLVAMAALLAACSSGPADTGPTTAAGSPSPSTTQSACPAGSADQPGDPTQARPALTESNQLAAADPTAPRIVVGATAFVPEGAGQSSLQSTWAFDVCTNSWTQLTDVTMPAGERATLGQLVTDPQAAVVRGLPLGLTPVWTFDPAGSAWTAAPATGGGTEAWPLGVFDPDAGRMLVLDPNLLGAGQGSSGVLAYDAATKAWSRIDLADPNAAVPTVGMSQADVAFDTAAGRLVLVITPEGSSKEAASTWVFDPKARTWTRGRDVPDTLAKGYPSTGWAAAFDPDSRRTWLFADTAMLGYDSRRDDWVIAERDAGWPQSVTVAGVEVDPMARIVGSMVADPANGRLVVIGGEVRRVGETAGGASPQGSLVATDDVWAYRPATNTWTQLLAASDQPASTGPG